MGFREALDEDENNPAGDDAGPGAAAFARRKKMPSRKTPARPPVVRPRIPWNASKAEPIPTFARTAARATATTPRPAVSHCAVRSHAWSFRFGPSLCRKSVTSAVLVLLRLVEIADCAAREDAGDHESGDAGGQLARNEERQDGIVARAGRRGFAG